jgi:hypothetical protein
MERQSGEEDGSGASERDVRRRRREAVVIHDGDGAIESVGMSMQDREEFERTWAEVVGQRDRVVGTGDDEFDRTWAQVTGRT